MDPKNAIKGGSFCPLPWTGFIMNPNGQIKNCVLAQEEIGNVNRKSIEDILSDDKNLEIKTNMLQHKKHNSCKGCHNLEQGTKGLNVRSDRYYYLRSLSAVPYSTYTLDNFELNTIDMRWRNTCNLACVYCGPELSSTWAKEINKPIIVDEEKINATKKYVLERAHNLKNVYLAGGEPLLLKENKELLDKLNKDSTIRINTNLSNLKGPVFKSASSFKNVHWTISVDTMQKEFEYIRYGAKWKDFIANLKIIKNLGHKISFNMLWLVLNPFSIFETIDYFRKEYEENAFIIGPITSPSALDIRNCNNFVLDNIRSLLINRMVRSNKKYLLHNSYENMFKHIQIPFTKKPKQTINFLDKLDSRRHLKYKNIFDITKYL